MFNSQYYTCEQIDQRLLQGYLDDYNSQNNTNLTKEQFLTLLFNTIGRNSTVDNLVTQISYYECDTAGETAAKAITVANYALFVGGSLKVKFINKNTANNATLNINNKGAKALYYQGERASDTNSWDANEVVEIYYDGTSYYANNINGGSGSGSGVYDVSKEHPTSGPNGDGKFTLEYILNSSNVDELIQVNKRYHGMSIQFVSTYYNKYVQYRLMADEWSTDTEDWAIADEGVYVDNPEFVYVKTDSNDKILWAIKIDGGIYYGAGVPQQIVDYINEKIAELSLDEYENIVAFLNDLEKGDKTLQTLLDGKVDKEEGKNLIDAEYANGVHYIENPEYIQVTTDSEDNVLEGITSEGVKQINLPIDTPSVTIEHIENPEWISVTTDSDRKILGGRKQDGTVVENMPQENPASIISYVDNPEWVEVKTDGKSKILEGIKKDGTKVENLSVENPNRRIIYNPSSEWLEITIDEDNKIIEGITIDGKKHIGEFDKETEMLIAKIAGGSSGNNDLIAISSLNDSFVSPIPVIITGTKGDENAKYEFELPLSEDAFNIRFRFRISENILNQNKSAIIAKLGNNTVVNASVVSLSQLTSTVSYNSETKTNHWATLKGGVRLNNSDVDRTVDRRSGRPVCNQNIGLFAFYIKYIGSESEAYLENDGTKLTLTAGNATTDYSFNDYPTVYELYAALRSNTDIEVSFNETENRNCSELAKFSSCKIKGLFYSGITGAGTEAIEEYVDAAPFFIPYAVDETWHKVEITKINGVVYITCDGVQTTTQDITSIDNVLTLGGYCGVFFKDLVIHTNTSGDAEIDNNGHIISSYNPYILIHEGHGMVNVPSGDGYSPDPMSVSADRLQYVYSIARSKGYVPVSIFDIADYYAGNRDLPKRCYTVIFDDYRFGNCMDIANRAVFTRLGIKPCLAIVTGYTDPITHNGETISLSTAVDICRMNNFDLVSHTRDHRNISNIKPSAYMSEFVSDVYDADIKGVNAGVIVYPYGESNPYEFDTLQWLGMRLGVSIAGAPFINSDNLSRYYLHREEIGFRTSIENVLSKIL